MFKFLSITALVSIFLMSKAFAEADVIKEKDKDKDGKLTIEEFAGDDKKLQKKFKKLDVDKDGSLSAEELKKAPEKKKKKKKK